MFESKTMNDIKLYNPPVQIIFNSHFENIQTILPEFKSGENENNFILYGEAMLTKYDPIYIHFYFDKTSQELTDFMIHSKKATVDDTLQKSFERKQVWLEDYYGKAKRSFINMRYPRNIWNFKYFDIEHFIKDRFGDEEGILFHVKADYEKT